MVSSITRPVIIRPFSESDIDQLLKFMKNLAAFEGYLKDFQVTESDLAERGLVDGPQFCALVAEQEDGKMLGMAVYYIVPFTYDLHPDLILKELFVAKDSRGCGVGEALISEVQQVAVGLGCKRIKWLVLSGNETARRFYERLGGRQDRKWENWSLKVPQR